MKNNLTAYFKFQLDENNPRFLTLSRRYGNFSGIKGIESRILKLRFTYSCKLFLQIQDTGPENAKLRFLHTLDLKRNGMAYFDCLSDAVLAIINPRIMAVELFIAPGMKRYGYNLFQQYLAGDLDERMSLLRRKSQGVDNNA